MGDFYPDAIQQPLVNHSDPGTLAQRTYQPLLVPVAGVVSALTRSPALP